MFKTLSLLLLLITCQEISGSTSSLHVECDPTAISSICGQYQRCAANENDRTKFYCTCQRNYEEINGNCNLITTTTSIPTLIPTNTSNQQADTTQSSSGSSIAVGILVPTFLIILGGLGFCCAKRYRLLSCRQNRYGNVLVTRDEDDDDDPPIA